MFQLNDHTYPHRCLKHRSTCSIKLCEITVLKTPKTTMQEHLSNDISGSSCHYGVYFMNLHAMRPTHTHTHTHWKWHTHTHTHTHTRAIWTKWHQACRPNGPAGTCKVRVRRGPIQSSFFFLSLSLSLPPSLALFGTIGGRDVRFGTCVGTSARTERRSLGIGGVKVRRRVTWRLSHGKSTLALSVCRVTERNASAECACVCVCVISALTRSARSL